MTEIQFDRPIVDRDRTVVRKVQVESLGHSRFELIMIDNDRDPAILPHSLMQCNEKSNDPFRF